MKLFTKNSDYLDFDKEHPNSIETPDGWKVEYLSIGNKPYDWELEEDLNWPFAPIEWSVIKDIHNGMISECLSNDFNDKLLGTLIDSCMRGRNKRRETEKLNA
jgi:hypothetical protein